MISRFIFCTMSSGSLAGPEIANQVVAPRSIPISLKVGTSWKSGRRLACVCMMALSAPPRTTGDEVHDPLRSPLVGYVLDLDSSREGLPYEVAGAAHAG